MIQKTNPNRRSLLLAVIFIIIIGGSSISVKAQYEPAIKVFKVGDRVEVNVANDVLTQNNWVKGTVTDIIYTDDNRILSYKVNTAKSGESPYTLQYGNKARVIRPLDNVDIEETKQMPSEKEVEQTTNADHSDSTADCSYEEFSEVKPAMKFTASLAKSEIYERYSFEKDTGGLSSPLAIGVTFLNMNLLGSYTNTVTVVPGRGAQRKHDGAPVNAVIYRFHAKYIVCRKYNNAVRRTQYESNNVCFKDKNGSWNCPVDSVPKIVELK